MTVDITTDIVIDRPLAEVSAFVADPSNAPQWYVNIERVEWKSVPPLRVGSQVAFVAKFLGKTLAYTYEFVEVLPEERVTMRTAQGPFPMATTYAWSAPTPGSTRMTLRNQGDPAGFSKLMAPFVSGAVRRANRKDLARLKKVLEAS